MAPSIFTSERWELELIWVNAESDHIHFEMQLEWKLELFIWNISASGAL